MLEPIFMKLGMYIMATESISVAYFIHLSRRSLCMCIPPIVDRQGSVKCIPPFGARQRFGKHVPAATTTRYSRFVGRVIFCAIRVLSKDSLWVCLCIPVLLLSKDVPAATKNCWRRRFLLGPCGVKGK
jgi:hypothetical protein